MCGGKADGNVVGDSSQEDISIKEDITIPSWYCLAVYIREQKAAGTIILSRLLNIISYDSARYHICADKAYRLIWQTVWCENEKSGSPNRLPGISGRACERAPSERDHPIPIQLKEPPSSTAVFIKNYI